MNSKPSRRATSLLHFSENLTKYTHKNTFSQFKTYYRVVNAPIVLHMTSQGKPYLFMFLYIISAKIIMYVLTFTM